MNIEIKSKVDKEDYAQLRSIPAQRLIEKLSLLKNRVSVAKRRWFWELLQNASDYNQTVNVKLLVTNSKVTFMHDGSPFSLRDALNLISPDSNKQTDESHTDNIGKFGTGLVSTHILSSIMNVEGLCVDDGISYKFHITLNRSCFESKPDLIEQIATAKDDFKESLIQCPIHSGFNTSFSYTLGDSLPTLVPLTASDIDLEYLYETLPYTLCFMPKVRSVIIQDERTNARISNYLISRKDTQRNQLNFEVKRESKVESITFLYFERSNISSVIRIKGRDICAFPKGLSKIFCGLPLIGTEDIGMPFLLNSPKFEPTTEREGVELEPGANNTNRELFAESVNLYNDVLDFVAKEKLNYAYNITKMFRKYNGTQASNQQFYQLYLDKYKQYVLTHSIVKNAESKFVSFASISIPYNNSKVDKDLYNRALLLKSQYLPFASDYEQWFESTDFSLFQDQKYTYVDLAKEIEEKVTIYSFGKRTDEVISWILLCAEYFKEHDRYIFSKYKILPNQNGDLCGVSSLYSDLNLPKELKEIYDALFAKNNKKVEAFLLDKRFNDLELSNKEYSMDMLAKDIDEELSNQYSENQGNTSSISIPLNSLYTWINNSNISKEKLAAWFHWYYPKRATLIVDMLTETQREQALVIAQSGKMKALATLASADITDDELNLIVANVKKLPVALSMLLSKVDDKEFADSNEGDTGENIVFQDLLRRYPQSKRFKVVWASKERNEPCFDFEILKDNKPFCYCDAKTTRRGIANSDSIPFFMRMSQWNFLQTLDESLPYLIARVFMEDGGQIKYMRISKSS